jgi:hypothetical protein
VSDHVPGARRFQFAKRYVNYFIFNTLSRHFS